MTLPLIHNPDFHVYHLVFFPCFFLFFSILLFFPLAFILLKSTLVVDNLPVPPTVLDAVMYCALARACNQSALPHNMPLVLQLFPIYGAKLTCLYGLSFLYGAMWNKHSSPLKNSIL